MQRAGTRAAAAVHAAAELAVQPADGGLRRGDVGRQRRGLGLRGRGVGDDELARRPPGTPIAYSPGPGRNASTRGLAVWPAGTTTLRDAPGPSTWTGVSTPAAARALTTSCVQPAGTVSDAVATPNFGSMSEKAPPSTRPPTLVNGTPIGISSCVVALLANALTCTV